MTTELLFDENNDHLTPDSDVVIGTADFNERFIFSYNGNADQILYGNPANTLNVLRITNNTTILIKLGATSTNVTLAAALSVGVHTIRIKRSGTTVDVTDDGGTSLLTGTATNAGSFTIFGFGQINAGGNRFGGGLQLAQHYSDAAGTILVHSWDASASDTGNTGLQPVLVDTVAGNDMNGNNMPTDGSAWNVFGGGVSITADSGSYSVSGTDVRLLVTSIMQANSGSYSISGTNVELLKCSVVDLASGSYSLTGTDATLTFTPLGSFTLIADTGTYNHTGADINFNRNRVMIASSGIYTLSGTDVQIILPGQIWTDKTSVSTSWGDQVNVVTNWNNQTNVTTIWTDK